jgi:tetratricopeptide (TPR) repeat protein
MALARVALEETVAHLQKGLALLAQLPPSTERDEIELSIREPLTAAWTGLHGWAWPELGVNATAILELAKRQGKPHGVLIGLWGMWLNAASQGRIAQSLEWAQRMLAEANESGDSDLRVFGHWAAVVSCYYLGQLLEAREHAHRALALYDPQGAERWMQLTGHDIKTGVDAYAAHWLWMLGYPDQAVRVSDERDAYARRLGHGFNLGFALSFGAAAFDHRREPEPLLQRIEEAYRLAREQSIPFLYQMLIPSNEGIARLRAGQLSESIRILRQHIESGPREGATRTPYMKACLAEALALQGDLGAATQLIDEGLEQIERPGWQERVHLAEILRLKGWMQMRQGRHEEAETQLRASIDWARQQQAKSWELRSSTTLAELLIQRGEYGAARQLLAPIYNWFTEGLDTKDLVAARQLLEGLR